MVVHRSVVIARTPQEVFSYLAEPANDPAWCPKVLSVLQTSGDGPGPGARYEVLHKPIPFKPTRRMDYSCLSWERPHRIQWRENDGTDEFIVTYLLEDLQEATRLTQQSRVQLSAPRVLHPVMRAGIGHDVARQLKNLKRVLEHQRDSAQAI